MNFQKSTMRFLCSLVAICFIAGGCSPGLKKERLSKDQMAVLREQYPVYTGVAAIVDISREMTLQEVGEASDTFVYGKIIGDSFRYSTNAESGIPALDEKQDSMGSREVEFYGYTLEVIRDTENKFEQNSIITIEVNATYTDMMPVLKDGIEVIVPVTEWATMERPNRYNYTRTGMYYVTPDDYVLSAYQEEEPIDFSGMTLESALDAIHDEVNRASTR